MPLQSRATTARAERIQGDAATATQTTAPNEATQPRKGREQVTKVPAADTAPDANTASQTAAQASPPADTTEKAPRKARTPRQAAAPAEGGQIDIKGLKQRQKEIEGEFKNMNKEMIAAQRAVTQQFAERRVALESEHRLISNQLSSAVFKG